MIEAQEILVTGANGYLGAQICQSLADRGHYVSALCYPEKPSDSDWCSKMKEVLVGSVAEESTYSMLQDKRYDCIVHLVSLDHHQSQQVPPQMAMHINVEPCWLLLDHFSKKGLKKFIYFSTIHVYGPLRSGTITENQALQPGNVYAMTHALCEQVCDYYNRTSDVQALVVRLSNSYGQPVFAQNNCWWLAVNDLCRSAFYEKTICLLSDGSPQRDFIHGSDVCRGVALLCEEASDRLKQSVYQISSAQTYTLLELAALVKDVYEERYGVSIPVRTPAEADVTDFVRFSGNIRYSIENQSLKDLGFIPKTDLRQGILELFRYFEKQNIHA